MKCDLTIQESKIKSYIPQLDLLRAISVFAVILLHTASQEWARIDHHTADWHILNFYNSISRFGVPVFVMISGTIFLNRTDLELSKLHKKNILRIITAFIFWSIVYAGVRLLRKELNLYGFITACLKGPMHLWFCCMIVGLYLIIPFLESINESKYRGYFLKLCIIFNFVIPMVLKIAEVLNPVIGNVISTPIRYMSFSFTGGYVFYFILGNAIQNREFTLKERKMVYVAGIIGFLLTIGCTARYARYLGKADELFLGNHTINVLLEAILVFVIVKCYDCSKLSKFSKNVIKKMSKYSFGMYLVHMLVLKAIYPIIFDELKIGYLVGVPVTAILTFLISFCVSAILNHIQCLQKYIV